MTTSCRRCGAALPAADGDGNQVCTSCGLFHAPDDAPLPPPPPPPGPSGPFGSGRPGQGQAARAAASAARSRPGRSRGRGSAGCVVGAIIAFLVVGGIVVAIVGAVRSVRGNGGGGDPEVTLTTGDGEVVLDADGQPTAIVGIVQRSGSTARVVARVSMEGEVAWEASVVPGDIYSAQARVAGGLALVSLGSEIVALDDATGALRWRVTVSDEVDARCRSCLTVMDDHLVVLTRDAYVTGLALADGEATWSRRLESPQGRVHVVGDTLLVADEPEDPEQPAALVLTDAATGDPQGEITPSCPDPAYGPDSDQVLEYDITSPVVPIPGADDIVVVFGFGRLCAQRWTVGTQQVRWTQALGEDISSLHDPAVAVDGTDLVLADTSSLVHIGLSEGTATLLPLPVDTSPSEALHLTDGTLVTAVSTSRGSTRWRLLALDLRTRELLWEEELPRGAEPSDLSESRSSDTVFEGSARFVLVPLDDDELGLVTMASPGARLTVEAVDLGTGRSRYVGRTTFAQRSYSSSSPSTRVELVSAGTVVLTTESIPQVLDVATGEVVASWRD